MPNDVKRHAWTYDNELALYRCRACGEMVDTSSDMAIADLEGCAR